MRSVNLSVFDAQAYGSTGNRMPGRIPYDALECRRRSAFRRLGRLCLRGLSENGSKSRGQRQDADCVDIEANHR